MSAFLRAFHDHPASVGESYFGHMLFALRFALILLAAAGAALVHAVIPPLFETTASRLVRDLHGHLEKRHSPAGLDQDQVTAGSRI